MKLKLKQGVSLSQNQAKEVANVIMEEPDIGWEKTREEKGSHVFDIKLQGEYGIYIYRVNLAFKLITLLKVKKLRA